MRRALPLFLLLLAGCVYYNGMYNANRFAKAAKKAEAQGRTFEAQGYWAQAEVRADSVVARHPNSTWADDAQLIRGESMVARNDCAGAIPALEVASFSRDSPEVAQQAQVLLGRCYLAAGNLDGADRAFVALMDSPDSTFRQTARLEHARILRLHGQYQPALATLEGLQGPAADAERAADYAGLGEVAQAEPLIDQALARQDLSVPWDSTIAGIGRVDPSLASRYTTAVVALPGLPAETRDALLMADGMRLLGTDPDSGLARLRAAGAADPVTFASLVARLRLAEYVIGQADTLGQLELAREGLTSLSEVGGASSIKAIHYLRILNRARGYADSVTPGAAQGDLATFALGEAVRDSLPAPRIAAQLFTTVPAWWPASPYAPKALLALAALEPARADSILQRIEMEYPGSPYLLLVAGDVTPAVLALEDSLQAYTGGGTSGQPAPGGRRAPAAGAPAGQRPQDELK
jgi:predicted negative regulator of RcsB-dependent stress response